MSDIEKIKKFLELQPLSMEGGHYAESYRSQEKILQKYLPQRYTGDKSFGSAIYYMLTPDEISAMHMLPTDEIFHFYLGDPVEMLQLYPDGTGKKFILGSDVLNGMHLQIVVPHGVWQGSRLVEGGQFSLMGTTMAPGFDYTDYKWGNMEELIKIYPQEFHSLIEYLTRYTGT